MLQPSRAGELPQVQRILVVDDDPSNLRLLDVKFQEAGFEVLLAESGEQALDLIARRGLPHLATVDLNMPGMGGFEFVRRVQAFCDLPVIILTADSEEETVIRAIQDYAEDYVVKPFNPRELVARIQRVLRRMGDFSYTLDGLTRVDSTPSVDFAQQRAIVQGKEVALTPTEPKLLYMLMRSAGRTVNSDFMLRRLWPSDEVFEDTLRVHVHRLRAKIEPRAKPGIPS